MVSLCLPQIATLGDIKLTNATWTNYNNDTVIEELGLDFSNVSMTSKTKTKISQFEKVTHIHIRTYQPITTYCQFTQ